MSEHSFTPIKLTSFLATLSAEAYSATKGHRRVDGYSGAEIRALVKYYLCIPDVSDLARHVGRSTGSVYLKVCQLREQGELDSPASMRHGRRPVRFLSLLALLPLGKALMAVVR